MKKPWLMLLSLGCLLLSGVLDPGLKQRSVATLDSLTTLVLQ